MDPGHPECPARLATVLEHLDETGLGDEVTVYEAGLAERIDLARVHTEPYLDALEQLAPARGLVHVTPDTAMGPGSLDAARAVGGRCRRRGGVGPGWARAARFLRRATARGITPRSLRPWASAS